MRFAHYAVASALTFGCTACVSVETIRTDAEAAFREHNRVAGEVMFALVELDADRPETAALAEADRAMLAACEPLNDLAIAHREGRQPTLRERLALPATIDECREATASAAALLPGR